jgi:glycosyltransferase involved in cell wall biosynthesis
MFIPIMRPIYKRSWLNIAHNEHDAAKYRRWGARTAILGTELYSYQRYPRTHLPTGNNIVVISTFAADEPTEEIVSAAKDLKNVQFYFTGGFERAKRRIPIEKLPTNITLTGFLPRDQFIGLVKAADAAVVLVKTENTMQMGAWEAMSCDTPVILSDWALLRSTFPKGAIFVKNTQESIREGLTCFYAKKGILKKEIISLRSEKGAIWTKEISAIESILKSREQQNMAQ